MNKQIIALICLSFIYTMTACASSESPTLETAMYTEETENSLYNTNSDISDKSANTFANSDLNSNMVSDINHGFESAETTNVSTELQFSEPTTFNSEPKGTRLYFDFPTETTTEYIPPELVEVKNLGDVGFWWSELEIRPICNEIANAFIDKDYDKIKSFFCEKTLLEHDVDTELTNAFNLIDGNIVRHDENVALPQSDGHSMRDGQIVSSFTDNTILGLYTDTGKKYEIVFVLVSNSDDKSKLGIHSISIREKISSFEHEKICTIGEYYKS